jgi:formate hydrogenlyase transcriptional activator
MLEERLESSPGPLKEHPVSTYEVLFRVSQVIREICDPDELFKVLADELHNIIDFNYVLILQWDDKTHRIQKDLIRVFDFPNVIEPPSVDIFESISSWMYQQQKPIVISDLAEETRFPVVSNCLKKSGIQSLCAFPLTTAHRKIGMLLFGSKHSKAYTESVVGYFALVASAVAIAIDDAPHFDGMKRAQEELRRAQEELQGEHDRLKLLLDFNNAVVSTLDFQELLHATMANVRRVMKCDATWIHLPDSERKHLPVIARDFPDEKGFYEDFRVPPIEGTIVGKVFLEGKPVAGRVETLVRDYEEYHRARGEGLVCGCVLPLISKNRVLGILSLARKTEQLIEENELEFLLQIANQLALAIENSLAYEEIAALKEKLEQEKLYLEDEIRTESGFEEIIGQSASLLHVLQQVETVAPTDSTVLVLGETGTGKELIARAIHNHSRRKDRTFVKLNCAAIPTGLLESELFGHEKGAFTGAIAQRIGRLELADQGTLFLDEVGDIPLELQSKLLRALQEREFERLGSSKTKKVDVRLIAATNRDLQKMVADHQFRSDLYYRLNVFPIRIPALRERPDDIPLLVRHFTQKYAIRMNRRIENIPAHIFKKFTSWTWPGNIRELENFIERSVILTQGTVLNAPLTELTAGGSVSDLLTVDSSERDQIIRMLKQTDGRVGGPAGAAARLGLKRTTLIARMKKYGINPHRLQ